MPFFYDKPSRYRENRGLLSLHGLYELFADITSFLYFYRGQ